jgi:hypothetical protein
MHPKSGIQLNTLLGGRSVDLSIINQIRTSTFAQLAFVHAWTLTVVKLMRLINTELGRQSANFDCNWHVYGNWEESCPSVMSPTDSF